jgi:hypothetical protein
MIKEVQGCKVCWQCDFEDYKSVLLVDVMHQGAAFSADACCITLEQLRAAMKKKFPQILMKGVLPLCHNAWLESFCSACGGLSWNGQHVVLTWNQATIICFLL